MFYRLHDFIGIHYYGELPKGAIVIPDDELEKIYPSEYFYLAPACVSWDEERGDYVLDVEGLAKMHQISEERIRLSEQSLDQYYYARDKEQNVKKYFNSIEVVVDIATGAILTDTTNMPDLVCLKILVPFDGLCISSGEVYKAGTFAKTLLVPSSELEQSIVDNRLFFVEI